MPANQALPRRTTRKAPSAPARPVQEMLLELAFRLHATKPVIQAPARGRR